VLQLYMLANLVVLDSYPQPEIDAADSVWIGALHPIICRVATVASFAIPITTAVIIWPTDDSRSDLAGRIVITGSILLSIALIYRLVSRWRKSHAQAVC
jgi:hypothetical protein